MTGEEWLRWVVNHAHPKAAQRVLAWLEKSDADEMTSQAADKLVDLVVDVIDDCACHVERFEGTDFEMRSKFQGP